MLRKDRVMESFKHFGKSATFCWSKHNCVGFSLNIIKAVYGIDILDKYKIIGTSQREYLRMLKTNEVFLSDLVNDNFSNKLETTLLAKKGDLLIEGEGYMQNMGICYGNGLGYFLKEEGLAPIKIEECTHAWRIGNE